jgi:hypothetical protein
MFVLVSSQAAAGPARDGRAVTEDDEPCPVSWYGLSKLEGENAVARSFPGPWCIIRPAVVYGPGDPGLLEMFRVVQKGIAPILAGGRRRLQLIAVQDLARMLVAAASRPDLARRRGFAATDVVSMGELARKIAVLRSPPAKPFPVPAIAIRAAGAIESIRQWLTRRPRPFNRDKAREILQNDWLCDAGPMLRDLLGIVSCQSLVVRAPLSVEGPIKNGLARPDHDERTIRTHLTGSTGSPQAGSGQAPSTGSGQAPPIPALTPWKDGLRELCRCYVRDQWLRQNIWAV